MFNRLSHDFLTILFNLVAFFNFLSSAHWIELDENFPLHVSNGPWLVKVNNKVRLNFVIKFYAPWCVYCQQLGEIYNEIAIALSNEGVKVAALDATRYRSIANTYNIHSYPTIKYINGDRVVEYNGERSVQEIVAFGRRLTGPNIKSIQNEEVFIKEIIGRPYSVAFIHVGEHGELYENLEKVATKLLPIAIFYEMQPENISDDYLKYLRISPDSSSKLLVCKDGHSIFYESNNISVDSIADWVKLERFVAFPLMNDVSIWNYGGETIPNAKINSNLSLSPPEHRMVCVFLISKTKDQGSASARFMEMGKRLAIQRSQNLHRFYQFGWTDELGKLSNLAMIYFGMPTPNILIIEPVSTQMFLHPDYDSPTGLAHLSQRSVVFFLEDVANGKFISFAGKGFMARVKRLFFTITSSYWFFFKSAPVWCAIISAIPIGFFSLFFYCICCADNDVIDESRLKKRRILSEKNKTHAIPISKSLANKPGTETEVKFRDNSISKTHIHGPVLSDKEISILRAQYHANLKTN